MIRGIGRIQVFVITIMILLTLIPMESHGESRNVSKSMELTKDVGTFDYDDYTFDAKDSKFEVELKVLSAGKLDFYLLTESQAKAYKNPLSVMFAYEEKEENAKVAKWKGSDVTLVVVVDNDYASDTGAYPNTNVTYSIKITISDVSFLEDFFFNSIGGVCSVLIILAVVTSYWLFTVPAKYKERAEVLKRKYT